MRRDILRGIRGAEWKRIEENEDQKEGGGFERDREREEGDNIQLRNLFLYILVEK